MTLGLFFASLFAGNFEKGMEAYKSHQLKKAATYFKLSADQGYALADLNLGGMYVYGHGVKQNKIAAYQWLMKAAKQGDLKAQNNLDRLCRQSPWACRESVLNRGCFLIRGVEDFVTL